MSVPKPNAVASVPDSLESQHEPQRAWVLAEELEPGDAYMEGPYMVFTAQFHLRRGYCCNSACRHCPYREADAATL